MLAILALILMVPSLADAVQARLVVRSLRGISRVTYVSPGLDVPLPIGGGPGDLLVDVSVAHGDAVTSFDIPPDAFDGTDGWRVNDAVRAVYLNRTRRSGRPGVRKTVIRAGGRIKFLASSLGDGVQQLMFVDPTAAARARRAVSK